MKKFLLQNKFLENNNEKKIEVKMHNDVNLFPPNTFLQMYSL